MKQQAVKIHCISALVVFVFVALTINVLEKNYWNNDYYLIGNNKKITFNWKKL